MWKYIFGPKFQSRAIFQPVTARARAYFNWITIYDDNDVYNEDDNYHYHDDNHDNDHDHHHDKNG